jgi:hypothetical protein
MTRLNKDQILKADDLPTEEVEVPEWGGSVLVRGMTGRQRIEYEASMAVMRGGEMVPDVENSMAKLVARTIVGDDGGPMFTVADANALGEKSSAALARVFEVAARLSGMSAGADVEAKKDSSLIPGTDFVSSSPATSATPSPNSSNGSPPPSSPDGTPSTSSSQMSG